jgi:polyhydroxyalkanoate synthesis regulator phasin
VPLELNPGHLTDAQARNLVIKSLRKVRQQFRNTDTIGEKVERELDRLIKRKTRINATSLNTLDKLYKEYEKQVAAMTVPLSDAYFVVSNF